MDLNKKYNNIVLCFFNVLKFCVFLLVFFNLSQKSTTLTPTNKVGSMFGLSEATELFQGSTERTWNCIWYYTQLIWSKLTEFGKPIVSIQ